VTIESEKFVTDAYRVRGTSYRPEYLVKDITNIYKISKFRRISDLD
jgi:hypothetical protein